MKVSSILLEQPDKNIISELVAKGIEVGMTEFNFNPEFESIPSNFDKIGNFELDVLAIEKLTGLVVMLDHDQLDFIMGKVAKNLSSFVRALMEIEKFFDEAKKDDKLYDNDEAMRKVAVKASEIAGGSEYINFYMMTFGI